MEDRELDSILNEIKQHADDGTKAEDSLPAAAKEDAAAQEAAEEVQHTEVLSESDTPDYSQYYAEGTEPTVTIDDTPAVDETPAEEAPAEEAPAEEAPAEEAPAEEAPAEEAADEGETDLFALSEEAAEPLPDEAEKKPDNKKKIIIAVVAAVLVIAVAAGLYFALFRKPAEEPTSAPSTEATTEMTTAAPVLSDLNPLTGEANFNPKAIGKRPIAVVVENEFGSNDYAQQSRPQWGINEADMVMEAESEFATRMLFFWADYTNVAEKVGPARSARPPFIRFAELFDGIFIHAGLSHSKGEYVGADTVFKKHNTDHVNLLEYAEGTYSGNDRSRPTQEHQHYFKGKSAPDLIKSKDFRTKANQERYTQFSFNEKIEDLSDKKANTVKIKWSDNAGKRGTFTYDEKSGTYNTTDFNSKYGTVDVAFENIVVIADNTKYIVKHNYKGSGHSETYCDYNLDGGKGMIASNGTCIDITWKVENKKIVLRKTDGTEAKLNPGKVYIAYISANHNGEFSAE